MRDRKAQFWVRLSVPGVCMVTQFLCKLCDMPESFIVHSYLSVSKPDGLETLCPMSAGTDMCYCYPKHKTAEQ